MLEKLSSNSTDMAPEIVQLEQAVPAVFKDIVNSISWNTNESEGHMSKHHKQGNNHQQGQSTVSAADMALQHQFIESIIVAQHCGTRCFLILARVA